MRVAFVHPDLGIGGAERLIVDAALALQANGHHPVIYTAHYDPSRSFSELSCNPPLVPFEAVPVTFIPRAIFGRCQAFLAALRCAFIALYVCFFRARSLDVAVVDLVSLPLLIFSFFRVPALFYCHFPDKLLAQSLLRQQARALPIRAYRAVIDASEALALRTAAHVACNSRFTARAFATVFPNLPTPSVIYPCVSVSGSNSRPASGAEPGREQLSEDDDGSLRTISNSASNPDPNPDPNPVFAAASELDTRLKDILLSDAPVFLSLNRYEEKKNHGLAVHALSHLLQSTTTTTTTSSSSPKRNSIHLIIAGGYDPRLPQNVSVHRELSALAATLSIDAHVSLLANVPDALRGALLARCAAVLYTPAHEHFGIVPLEAMRARRPVVAVRSGGPCETVAHGATGFLCDPDPAAFARAMAAIVDDPAAADRMGASGRSRAARLFSRDALGRDLDRVVRAIGGRK